MALITRRFPALGERNFRRYLFGQSISQSGTWMQNVGQALLVLDLSRSGTDLGLVVAAQYLPMLLLGPIGGLVIDRLDTRRCLLATQSASAALAALLGMLTAVDATRLWMVYCFAAVLGLVNAVDTTARQIFIFDLVGADRLPNAIGINNVNSNAARIIGPSVAGLLAATVGTAACFLINAATFVVMVAVLLLIRIGERYRPIVEPSGRGQLREGFAYVRKRPEMMATLALAAVVGTFAWEFQVTLPLLAEFTYGGSPTAYGLMFSCRAVGSVIGGVAAATLWAPSGRNFAVLGVALGVTIVAAAAAPTLPLTLAALVPVGAMATALVSIGNTLLQLSSEPGMRGRVISLWTAAVLGTTPIGAPIVGWIGDALGPRYGLGFGGVAAIIGALLVLPVLFRRPVPPNPTDPAT